MVMAVIPFGLCGAIADHLIMGVGYTDFLSALGIVALSGVVVNASLVLVHAVNRFRDLGWEWFSTQKGGTVTSRA